MGDVIVNGIPMAYDSAGHQHYNLETAGMFDITRLRKVENLFLLNLRKNLEVELASASNSEQTDLTSII